MDVAVTSPPRAPRHPLLWVLVAPVVPQVLGSIFSIWYNSVLIEPLLGEGELRHRFYSTVLIFNAVVYPIGVGLWFWRVLSLRPVWRRLEAGLPVEQGTLVKARRRAIHLPWWGAGISLGGWLLGVPSFLLSLAAAATPAPTGLMWHLAIAFCVSALIVVANTFFLVELTTQWALFPALFRDTRADRTPGVVTMSLRARGLLWAIAASICPIVALLLLRFAPIFPAREAIWFSVFVGVLGVVSGLGTALLVSRLVAQPLDQLRTAAQDVARGNLEVELPVTRADEFGVLLGEFNQMTRQLKDKARLRETFGLHVGQRVAEQILARDPGLGGIEQELTVMFVDIRSFTALADHVSPGETLDILNQFLRVSVRVVEEEHDGMIQKFLGDGFLALFGVGTEPGSNHARAAFAAGRGILQAVDLLNEEFAAQGRKPLRIGIGIHTGPAIVGSIGSPARLEFTAIGATVNLAARIEGLTKEVKCPLLVTGATRASLGEDGPLRELPPREVRGLVEPVTVFAFWPQTAT